MVHATDIFGHMYKRAGGGGFCESFVHGKRSFENNSLHVNRRKRMRARAVATCEYTQRHFSLFGTTSNVADVFI